MGHSPTIGGIGYILADPMRHHPKGGNFIGCLPYVEDDWNSPIIQCETDDFIIFIGCLHYVEYD